MKTEMKTEMKTIAQQLNIQEFPFEIKDKKGNLIYYETSKGSWEKIEFDSYGNEIYFEDSNGYWVKREYDSNGNNIYTEYPDGRWYKKEYDSYGNPTLYENSNGYVENSGPKDGVTEIDDKECQLKEEMKRTLIIYNTRETTQEEATHLLDILNCDDSMLWDNADRCGVEIIEVPTDKTKNEMKTIAQQLNITEFPFVIKDKNGNEIYSEYSDGRWYKKEYDSYGNLTRFENSNGYVEDEGPKDEA